MAYKKRQDRNQRFFPDCIDEHVEADAPVRLFDAFVDSLKMEELGFIVVRLQRQLDDHIKRLDEHISIYLEELDACDHEEERK